MEMHGMSATVPPPHGPGPRRSKATTVSKANRKKRTTTARAARQDAWRLDGGDGPLGQYLAEIQRFPLIPPDEEPALAKRIADGDDEAFNRLVEGNLRFVVSVAKKFQHFGVPLSDLINEGNVGLCQAARKFDGSRGVKFISYAVWWIRQGILVLLAEQGRIARIPVNRAGEMHKISRAAARLEQELGRTPSASEIAKAIDVTVRDVEEVLLLSRVPVSVDLTTSRPEDQAGGEAPAAELLTLANQRGADVATDRRGMHDAIERVLQQLKPRERRIVELYFGLGGADPHTLEEISAMERVTRERVRQIKEHAIEKLRDAGVEIGLQDYHGD